MIAANSASSSSYDVRIRAAIDGILRSDLTTDVDAGAVGQPAVEDRDVGPKRRDSADRLLRQTRLPDDLDVAVLLEELLEPAADDLVVVEQEHADLRSRLLLSFVHASG